MHNSYKDNWDNKTLNYDIERYNFSEWVLNVIQQDYPNLTDLQYLHTCVKSENLVNITDKVQKSFAERSFGKMIDDFAEEYIKPLIGDNKYLVKRFPTLNLVVPNQEKLGRRLHFHQGIFYNNGRGQGTIWMPLTNCYESNSMWIVGYEDSKNITKEIVEYKTSQDVFEKMSLDKAFPVTLSPGQAHLFHQEHIHGNVNNKTNVTRMAIDWHVLVEGEEFNGRYPGGFFRLPKEYEQEKVKINNASIYLSNNSDFDKHIPLHIQRNYIVNYCEQNNIQYSGYVFENEHLEHLPILEDMINKAQNVIMLSIYSLPNDKELRNHYLNLAINNNVDIIFVNELLKLSKDSLANINTYLEFGFKQKGWHSWES
jgi:sporadic carbohydrate cluster 2OG-Fe(II) oxygenase/sporadic carbohydrate cluster protein (TIGR04323 family)